MEKSVLRSKKNRIWELDFLRGFAIIMVCFDHAFYDFRYLFSEWGSGEVDFLYKLYSLGDAYVSSAVRLDWRPAFVFVFFCVSGICSSLSRSNFLRGLKVTTAAFLLSIVTFIAEEITGESTFILFGVLHCLGFVTLIYATIEFIIRNVTRLGYKLAKKESSIKVENLVLCIVSLALAGAFLAINIKYNVKQKDVSSVYATIEEDYGPLTGLFFYKNNWWYGDYFPLFPFISFFFFGAGIGRLLYSKKKSLLPCLDGVWHNLFSVAGRHSLAVYLGWQAVAIGVCYLLTITLF